MERQNYALFVDLENTGGKVTTLTSVIEKVKIRGDILLGKVYGYSEQFADLKETLLSNTFQVVPSLRFGFHQKNHMDIQLVIDALDVAYTQPLIDCFCIVSGDSDYTPLVGKLKSMGKFVLGISRSEVASSIFINACNEFNFLETVSPAKPEPVEPQTEEGDAMEELMNTVERILSEQTDEQGFVHASQIKSTLCRLRPDFSEKNYGVSSFGKLLALLESRYQKICLVNDSYTLKVGLVRERDARTPKVITKENWRQVVQGILNNYRESGFDRVNPSVLKAEILNDYPGFEERQIGFKRFSDVMKQLERENRVQVEMNEAKTMLIKIL
ncbi:MAG: NYN domain-containing protein [Christensenellales bacterium]|jgi:hypothetical protein